MIRDLALAAVLAKDEEALRSFSVRGQGILLHLIAASLLLPLIEDATRLSLWLTVNFPAVTPGTPRWSPWRSTASGSRAPMTR